MVATFVIFILVTILAACTGVPATVAPANIEEPAVAVATQQPASSEIPVTSCGTLLPPETCNPEWTAGITYTPLINLSAGDCRTRLLDEGTGSCVALTYNNNGQDFIITVEGSDPVLVQDYINTAKAYFIVQNTGGVIPPTDLGLPSLSVILIETAVEYTGLPQEELSIQRDKLVEERGVEGIYVTLADVIAMITGDLAIVDKVLEVATARAYSEFTAAGISAGLGQPEIDALTSTIYDEIKALMYEPGAPFLFDPILIPQDDGRLRDTLITNPAALLMTMEWVSAPKEDTGNLWVIWYSFDPPLVSMPVRYATNINAWVTHNYKAKCNYYSASAGVTASAGSMTLSFWRMSPNYLFIGSRTANVQVNAAPGSMWHSSWPNPRSYDISVVGGRNGGTYTLSGGWIQGSGCQ
jgi:hypothetical protein